MRSQFAFYKSFDDVYQDLSDKQRLEFMQIILDVQFLRLKVEDVTFKDTLLKHIWNAQKHSIEKSIKGYLESQKNPKIKEPYMGIYDPLFIPSEGVHKEEQEKEEEQGEEKGKEKEETKKRNKSFYTLTKLTSFDNLTEEYTTKLEKKIEEHNEALYNKRIKYNSPLTELLSYEEFSNRFLANGKKQKDFWRTFLQYEKYTFEAESKRKGIKC